MTQNKASTSALRTCWWPDCGRRAVDRDWAGWWWCLDHLIEQGREWDT